MTTPTRGHTNCLLLGLLLPLARDDKFEDLVFARARDLAFADIFAALQTMTRSPTAKIPAIDER